jgi:hypothetical protein
MKRSRAALNKKKPKEQTGARLKVREKRFDRLEVKGERKNLEIMMVAE